MEIISSEDDMTVSKIAELIDNKYDLDDPEVLINCMAFVEATRAIGRNNNDSE